MELLRKIFPFESRGRVVRYKGTRKVLKKSVTEDRLVYQMV